MTLAEFLLDRVAEDEHEARIANLPDEYFTPDRVLAECEAKRGLVDMWMAAALTPAEGETLLVRNLDRVAIVARTVALRDAMLALALPFADHPDYPAAVGVHTTHHKDTP